MQKSESKVEPISLESLFDQEFYLSGFLPDDRPGDPISHYLTTGWKEGRDPAPWFSSVHYLSMHQDVAATGMNPFLHYCLHGQAESRTLLPPDPKGYYKPTSNSISHEHPNMPPTETNGKEEPAQDGPDAWAIENLFDMEFYLAGFAQDDLPDDPISHYLAIGWKEGRDPAPWFSSVHYLSMHQDVAATGMNPFLHYCVAGHLEDRELMRLGRRNDKTVFDSHAIAVSPGPDFEEFDSTISIGRRKRAKVLAYYLPQFHRVPINDMNWGTGFTEWSNLPRALPRFHGHIQPRIPRDLGCYDLSESDIMRRQIALAKEAGLFGFCFYHYWFDGQRVLENPVERFLADPTLDFPFCLMWANENWTRTWDGHESDVILDQNYRKEDEIQFIDDIARHMKDPRYIRLEERPLFFIYRPGQIPNSKETIAHWRALIAERHDLNPLFFMAQGFQDLDPRVYGLDGAIEFPPHKICQDLPEINDKVSLFDFDYRGRILDYDAMVERSCNETDAEYPLIRTVTPMWDNEPRRPGSGTIIYGSTPAKFQNWIDQMLDYAEANPVCGEQFICVNAWNEWAEGAVLEPDVHHGAAYLNALSRAVHNASMRNNAMGLKIILVGHDANINGAQQLLLNIGLTLTRDFGLEIAYLLCDGGPMIEQYRKIGEVHLATKGTQSTNDILARLTGLGFKLAITNTTVSGWLLPALKGAGLKVVSLIHELPNLLRSYDLTSEAKAIADNSDHVIFPSEVVLEGFTGLTGVIKNQTGILPQGLFNTNVLEIPIGDGGLRSELGLKSTMKIVLGVGFADLRKGIDRFVTVALSMCTANDNVAFLWVGPPAGETLQWFEPEIAASGLGDRLRILGQRDDLERFYAAADAFYLPSREDPFPSVVLEALAVGLPVVGHKGCGGCDALIEKHGTLVLQSDPLGAVAALSNAVKKSNKRAAKFRRAEIVQNYNFPTYVFGLIQRLVPNLASVSAVIPNYKYETYIGERLRSVFDQTLPLREVIVLDDASPDESVVEIEQTAQAAGRKIALDVNIRNSGSPFPQWLKGAEQAQGEYVWIAEADDLADPSFVERLIEQMQVAGSVLGFTDSRQIDENGAPLADSYRSYLNEIEPGAFDAPFNMDGPEFLAQFLAVQNVILNVSGVIFHRQTLLDAFDVIGKELSSYNVAGDWRLYMEICAQPGSRISFLLDPLNTHRRHGTSVTHALKVEKHLAEIEEMHRVAATKTELSAKTMERQVEHFHACEKHLNGT